MAKIQTDKIRDQISSKAVLSDLSVGKVYVFITYFNLNCLFSSLFTSI